MGKENGTEVESDSWNGTDLGVRLDGLNLGVYSYHIFLNDTSGNVAEDEVIVSIADLIAPTIDHPADVLTIEGIKGLSISWTPIDLFPESYSIYMDGLLVENEEWDGSSIAYSLDGLLVGVHNCTIVVTDVNGNSVIDYVRVEVLSWDDVTFPTSTTTTTSPTVPTTGEPTMPEPGIILIIVLLSFAIIVGVLNIVLMKKRGE